MIPHSQIFSFFAGVGFLDLGFENEGYDISFVNELHGPFLDAYRFSRKNMGIQEPVYGYSPQSAVDFLNGKDKQRLTEIVMESRKLGNTIGFIAGPPCPDFSIGGKNRGHLGDRGKLSEAYVDLIIQHQPDFFLFENVKGLWKTKKHREFFDYIQKKIIDAGYYITDRLVNSVDYGVPQDRERIIFLGFKGKLLSDVGLMFYTSNGRLPEGCFPWRSYAKYSKQELDKLPWPTVTPFVEDSDLDCPGGIPEELTVEYWFRKNNVTDHPNARTHFQPRNGLKRFQTVDEGDDSKKSFKRLHRWRYSPTAAYGNNEVHLHPYKVRRISAAEALSIQSLPKEYAFPPGMTLSNAFKAAGNGVPYLLSKAIARSIQDFLGV